MRPFQQLRFDDLPELPRRPHAWDRAAQHVTTLRSRPFGAVRVVWRTYGNGPPLLLVHGLMTAGYSWRYAIEPLGERFTCFVPDLVGAGASEPVDASYAPDALATFLAELQDALGIRGCAVIGNSLGGYLCMRLALQDPSAIGRLVNLHSPGVPLRRLHALKAALRLPGSGRLLRRLIHRDPERWVHHNVHYWDETLKSREETRTYAAPLASPEGVRAFGAILRDTLDPVEMARFLATLAAGPFPVPLLLVYAKQDPMVPPAVGQALRGLLPDAGFVEIAEASHFAHVDAVEAFVAAVLPFLESRP
jgi:pimeloyl-ACP methyl ester carboxylesterase